MPCGYSAGEHDDHRRTRVRLSAYDIWAAFQHAISGLPWKGVAWWQELDNQDNCAFDILRLQCNALARCRWLRWEGAYWVQPGVSGCVSPASWICRAESSERAACWSNSDALPPLASPLPLPRSQYSNTLR